MYHATISANNTGDDATVESRKTISSRSTPDGVTVTHNAQLTTHDEYTVVPYVPDHASAGTPLRDEQRTGLTVVTNSTQHGQSGLPHHMFSDDFSNMNPGATALAPESTVVGGFGTANSTPRMAGSGLHSDASFGGNPFVASSDDEALIARHRIVKASSPPVIAHSPNNLISTTPAKPSFSALPATTTLRIGADADDDPFGLGNGLPNSQPPPSSADQDPFHAGPDLRKEATALQEDPFTDAGYYRNVHTDEVDEAPDPFSAFGNASAPQQTSFVNPSNDVATASRRRASHFGPNSSQPQAVQSSTAPSHRRQSVALALAQGKPKEKRLSFLDENPQGDRGGSHIDVVSTIPKDNGTQGEADGGFCSADQVAAQKATEQLFMPNLKREQYIPVRVAREKMKQLLAEMAQMKQMHLSAIDTMEKQHQFLKAQLESACAAYCRKLTADYNNRVVALNREYKRRLEGGTVRAPTPPSGPTQKEYDYLKIKLENAQKELGELREAYDRSVSQTHELLERAEEAETELKSAKETVRAFELKLKQQQQQHMMQMQELEAQNEMSQRSQEHRTAQPTPPVQSIHSAPQTPPQQYQLTAEDFPPANAEDIGTNARENAIATHSAAPSPPPAQLIHSAPQTPPQQYQLTAEDFPPAYTEEAGATVHENTFATHSAAGPSGLSPNPGESDGAVMYSPAEGRSPSVDHQGRASSTPPPQQSAAADPEAMDGEGAPAFGTYKAFHEELEC